MKKAYLTGMFFAMCSIVALGACSDDDTTPPEVDQGGVADAASSSDGQVAADAGSEDAPTGDSATPTSLTNDVLPIVAAQCGFCHTRTDPPVAEAVANNVYLETKDDLLSRIGTAIIAGDSANSGLIKIMKQEIGVGDNNTVMPPPPSQRDPMSAADIAVVAKWIDEGAQDN